MLGVELSTSPRYWALTKAGEKPQGFIIHVKSNIKGRDRVWVSPGQKSPPFGSLLFDPGPKAHTVSESTTVGIRGQGEAAHCGRRKAGDEEK